MRGAGEHLVTDTTRRSTRLWVAAIALVAAVFFVYYCVTRWTHRPAPRTAYWSEKLRQIQPVTSDMAPFGDIEVVMAQSEVLLQDPMRPFSSRLNIDNVNRGPWDPESNEDIAVAVAIFESRAFKTACSEFRDVIERGWAQPAILDVQREGYAYLRGFRSWGYLLLAYSRYANEDMDDRAIQARVWDDILKAAKLVERSRNAVEAMSVASCRMLVANEIAYAVSEMKEDQRIPFVPHLLATEEELQLRPSDLLAGVVINQRSDLDRLYVDDGGWLDVQLAASTDPVNPTSVSRIWNLTAPIFFNRREAESTLNDFLGGLDGCMDGATLRRDFGNNLDEFPMTTPLMYASRDFKWPRLYIYVLDQAYAGRTSCEAAACMIALQNYRADHSEYPASLDALVPDYLPRLPIDFGDRKPLRYRVADRGFVLYSVGGDGIDEGARSSRTHISYGEWQSFGYDVVFGGERRPEAFAR